MEDSETITYYELFIYDSRNIKLFHEFFRRAFNSIGKYKNCESIIIYLGLYDNCITLKSKTGLVSPPFYYCYYLIGKNTYSKTPNISNLYKAERNGDQQYFTVKMNYF